jgi:hypothetical protein
MGTITKEALEKKRARRKKKVSKNMPTANQAILNALQKGYITEEQVAEYKKEQHKKNSAKEALKKSLKKKPKAKIIYGLNTNSM